MTALTVDDPSGEVAQNGRDIGLQLQGDLLPVGKDKRRLIRYQAAVFNGNGQNRKDNNKQKDWMGNIQVQPVKDLYIGLFGWTGTYTGQNGASVRRNRWALGSIYEHNDWTFKASTRKLRLGEKARLAEQTAGISFLACQLPLG